jgi:hypothetical protein
MQSSCNTTLSIKFPSCVYLLLFVSFLVPLHHSNCVLHPIPFILCHHYTSDSYCSPRRLFPLFVSPETSSRLSPQPNLQLGCSSHTSAYCWGFAPWTLLGMTVTIHGQHRSSPKTYSTKLTSSGAHKTGTCINCVYSIQYHLSTIREIGTVIVAKCAIVEFTVISFTDEILANS